MRIAVVTFSRRRIGGTEAYLATVMRALQSGGHNLALVSELDEPIDRESIAPRSVEDWCAEAIGAEQVLAQLRHWQPDILYAHGLQDPAFEADVLQIAPGLFFAHGFYGTCISGAKSFKTPVARPCDRRFGLLCLLHYYPHRCGGWSPVAMTRDYARQARRLQLLRRYAAIVTHSQHIELEYLKHGIPPDRVHRVPYCTEEPGASLGQVRNSGASTQDDRPHLVFLGRMTPVKGGELFLRALPLIQAALGRDLRVTFGGDGTERKSWERKAARLHARHPGIRVSFTGWLTSSQRDALLDESDLLVVPSVWPEPLGLVGIEAGMRGVPAAAFAVGGIPEWLENGLNGFLADADPPSAQGLAMAVVACFRDRVTLARLRRGAVEIAARHSVASHLAALEPIMTSVARPVPVIGGTSTA